MEKVLEMLVDERKREIQMRGSLSDAPIIGGMQTVPILDGSERLGYKVVNIVTKEEAIMAHKSIDSRLRVCLLYTSPSPRDRSLSRMPSSA